MEKEGMSFPLHLGVTEAGDGEDGRIKSAFGIGALLSDGIGDTIRVSLSEAPEAEIPVARKLVDYITARNFHPGIDATASDKFDYLNPSQRPSNAIYNIGGGQTPVVIACRLGENKNEIDEAFKPDYIYVGNKLPQELLPEMNYIVDAEEWHDVPNTYPAFNYKHFPFIASCPAKLKFLFLPYAVFNEEAIACLKRHPEVVVISQSNHPNRLGEHRALAHKMMNEGLQNPIVIFQHYNEDNGEDFQIKSAADMGALIIDGLCDGISLLNMGQLPDKTIDATAFGILQAGRVRTSKTEYISCPSCGRTLFDLQKTIARIKAATKDLKGLKIGIMGCIVNGPGEMADADYGYVGAGPGRVSLYKQKVCIEKNIPEDEAVDKLLAFIKKDRTEK
jgi:(E)-4-hydroxy-3-methylbut-2-enyl-diphosphate synthase